MCCPCEQDSVKVYASADRHGATRGGICAYPVDNGCFRNASVKSFPSFYHDEGDCVTFTAFAHKGYEFAGWEGFPVQGPHITYYTFDGHQVGVGPIAVAGFQSHSIAIDSGDPDLPDDFTVDARFQRGPHYTLTTQVAPTDDSPPDPPWCIGCVTRSPNYQYYADGEQVTLTAVPNDCWEFDHWEGLDDILSPEQREQDVIEIPIGQQKAGVRRQAIAKMEPRNKAMGLIGVGAATDGGYNTQEFTNARTWLTYMKYAWQLTPFLDEARFLEKLKRTGYRVVHIRTHGGCHDEQGYLGFGPDRLYRSEIEEEIGSSYSYDLVIVTACQVGEDAYNMMLAFNTTAFIGWEGPVFFDDQAADFAEWLYAELAEGKTIETAFTEAKDQHETAYSSRPGYTGVPVLENVIDFTLK